MTQDLKNKFGLGSDNKQENQGVPTTEWFKFNYNLKYVIELQLQRQ